MKYAIQWLRSAFYEIHVYLMMAVIGIAFFPWALVSPKGARVACMTYARYAIWSLGWMVGVKAEVRGTPPTDEVLIAAKHQSFLDILMIFAAVPSGKFIMKRELMFVPFIGVYGYRIGCVPVNRGKRGQAIRKMVADVSNGLTAPGQLIIYSQGTRTAPGVKMPYKVGSAVLYDQLGQDCVPVATNAGLFWSRRGIYKKPGTAVVEFLPRIESGMGKNEFLSELEVRVETASDNLMREAGFDVDNHNA